MDHSLCMKQGGRKVLYVRVLRAIYGMIISGLLWYNKFRSNLEEKGFNDPCVANKMINRKQQTIRFHVDDLMSSHIDPKVNDEFHDWLNMKYGEYGAVTCLIGKVHEYLGMTLDYREKGTFIVDVRKYVEGML